ncbi:MAG: hypothetical protein HFI64_14380 [Lachnospiraceae bacterium]|nr:hypothetical protein [Lachnospiraceae bacterium]
MKKWRYILILCAFIIVIIGGYMVKRGLSVAPKLDAGRIEDMEIKRVAKEGSSGKKRVYTYVLDSSDISLVCTLLNKMKKEFVGTSAGKGWEIWITYNNNQEICIAGNIIVYYGIIDRVFTVSEEEIQEIFVLMDEMEESVL